MGDQNISRNVPASPNRETGNRLGQQRVVFKSAELFGSANEICIEHEELIYRLRITRQGKLILNK
ncbi:MAG: hemin uptake protein HemP [Pseudomonadota bacterium]